MTTPLRLTPVEMTEAVMANLEKRGLIIRLVPGGHDLPVRPGEGRGEAVYKSEPAHGTHMLLAVTVDRPGFSAFGSHPGNEEFLFIGQPATKPLYLAVALHRKGELNRRIADQTLTAADFVCLRVRYNDPRLSFFTMLADVPHGEAVDDTEGQAPSFYVTEPSDMGIEFTDFKEYEIAVNTPCP